MTIDQTAQQLILHALRLNATDIHISPRTKNYTIHFRMDGDLHFIKEIPLTIGEKLISHIKFMADMDISERRKPQTGTLRSNFTEHHHISLRISSLPTALTNESIAIRILPQKQILSHLQLSLFPGSIKILTTFMEKENGFVLLTGPTGCGKSTTMYSLAQYAAVDLNRHVISLEDPVEKKNDSLLQVQVNEKAGLTFATGLKAILRHDPDVILIGEIRDTETAQIALRAAMTGHLVLTSLHTKDAKGAVHRLMDLGISLMDLKQTVLAIASQRLVNVICPLCGEHCSVFCTHYKRRAVLEILHGHRLQTVLDNPDMHSFHHPHPKTLENVIRKGIVLGYLSPKEYVRWIVE